MPDTEKVDKPNWLNILGLAFLPFLFSVMIFMMDINAPSDIAIGCVYSIVILSSWILPSQKAPIYVGVYCTILVIVGFLYAFHDDTELHVKSINRIISVIVVWVSTALVTIAKKGFLSLAESNEKLEEKVKERTKIIEFRNKELEQFVYISSHDLQEPLRTVRSFVDLFEKDYEDKLDEKGKKYLGFITQSASRMSLLIKGVLDYSRIGRSDKKGLVDIKAIVNDIMVDEFNEKQAIEIKTSDLPQVIGNEEELRLLFFNLFTNAVKFKKPNITSIIKVSAKKEDSNWLFCVRDNGIGIDEENFQRIFKIFQRLHVRSEFDGLGIGLSHCQKIVEHHGGRIWLKSIKGEGSKFYFTLPSLM